MTVTALVEPDKNTLRVQFIGRLDPITTFDEFITKFDANLPTTDSPVIFDFSKCTRAFPNALLPLLCEFLIVQRGGTECRYVAPDDAAVSSIFSSTGISHLFDPLNHSPSSTASGRHLVATHVKTANEQHELVSNIIDLLMRSTPLNATVLNAFRWIINEVSGNIFDHSKSPIGGFVQLDLHTSTNRLALCVCDPGDGILSSIKSAGLHGHIATCAEAVEYAVRRGVTRDPSSNQGNGLAGSLELAKAFHGRFAIRSGNGYFLWEDGRSVSRPRTMNTFMQGTLVDVQLDMQVTVDNLGEFITGTPDTRYQPHDVISDEFLDLQSDCLRLDMNRETFGFGNREAGIQMYNKCQNLIRNDHRRIIIDWSGVSMIASSFADEFVGKLFADLGPVDFSSRIVQQGMDKTVKHILNTAIAQRLAQRGGLR